MCSLGSPHTKPRTKFEITSSSNFGDIDAGMVDMTSNDLETKVEVIHFGANRFLIYNFLYAVNSGSIESAELS